MPKPELNLDDINSFLEGLPSRPTAGTREWFRIRASADNPGAAEIDVYGEIGSWYDGVTAKDFIAALKGLSADTKTITVHVNSPGGDVFEALTIANALRAHPAQVVMLIEGLAASAATIITQGGSDVVRMADNAILMIHNPASIAWGTAKDMRTMADALDRVKSAIVATYQRKSALGRDQLTALMDNETWMDANEALANGFATEVSDGLKAAASISRRAIAALAVPEKHKAAIAALVRGAVRIGNDMSVAAGAKGTSIEEYSQAVYGALRAELGDAWAAGAIPWYVVQTYQDGVVINRNGETFLYPVTVSGDGDEVTLGDPIEVEMVWVEENDAPPVGGTPAPTAPSIINLGRIGGAARVPVVTAKAHPPTPAPEDAPKAAEAAEVVGLCADAGLDLPYAKKLIAEGLPTAAVAERIAGEKKARATAAARSTEIRALCVKAGQEDLAEGYIAGGMALDQVRDHLTKITARLDKVVEINSGLGPEQHSPRREPVIDVRAVYAERNRLRLPESKE